MSGPLPVTLPTATRADTPHPTPAAITLYSILPVGCVVPLHTALHTVLNNVADTETTIAFKTARPLVQKLLRFKLTKRLWQEAVGAVVNTPSSIEPGVLYPAGQTTDTTWKIVGRSFIRMTAGDFGFVTG